MYTRAPWRTFEAHYQNFPPELGAGLAMTRSGGEFVQKEGEKFFLIFFGGLWYDFRD